jgi:hypothetical protein
LWSADEYSAKQLYGLSFKMFPPLVTKSVRQAFVHNEEIGIQFTVIVHRAPRYAGNPGVDDPGLTASSCCLIVFQNQS